jgi:predicted RecB family endonuclease
MLAPDPRFDRIDGLDGLEFEAAVAELLQLMGFEQVERVGGFDKGADIIAIRDGVRTAVQVKRWSTPVDLKSVRQLVDGTRRYACEAGLLVTNSFLTEPAVECAEAWGIEVWDRRTLADFLDGEAPDVDTTVCAECKEPVSEGTTSWCLSHPARYSGFVYCRKHQARSQRRRG